MKVATLETLKQFKDLMYIDLNSSNNTNNTVSTVEMKYEYDGDNTSDNNTWVTNYGGTKVFVKMGEIPEGTINLVGSTIFRTNPNNQWLDRTFTIT